MAGEPAESAATPAQTANRAANHSEAAVEAHAEGQAGPPGDGRKALTAGDSGESIRVRVGLLNQLMNLAGELVLGRNQLMQRLAGASDGIAGLNTILQHVDRVTSEVQEAVMQTRMQPIGSLFSRFHRVTRDLARSLNKQIDLTLTGETVELDKSLIEALADPLTHLIRNCSDHGIEKPDVRTKAGKRAAGTISLSAQQEGGKVRVIVADDGAGVNIERVKQKALEKALITREQSQQMSERDVLQLLFAPGFSTAESVTGVSGRGVGMDVVRENVSRIGGTVEIETAAGEGTTFYLDLPLTLAIIPALIVTASGQRFAIPQVNMLELVHLDGNEATTDLLHVGETEVYRLRGTMLPIVRLGPALGLDRAVDEQETGSVSIAVVAAGNKQYGLVVDRIHDTEEIVVKPLGHLLKNLPVYAGATLMGDGRPALILDMAGVAKTANITLQEEKGFDSRATDQQTQAASDEQTLLLFSVGEGDQFAVPLSLLSRLEEVPADRITTSLQGKVIPYRGRLLPLVMLEDILAVAPPPQREKLTILVFEIEREVGLVATRIVDAVKTSVTLDSDAIATKGITGLALVQDRPTSFIDIYQIIEMAYPHWFQHDRSTRRKSVESGQVTILLAEDSSFYRTVEKNYLVQSGFNVVEAEDGERALELLKTVHVDLVITDIEMPKLDGFMLTRRIRENPKLHDLPVIAVTSLATEADRQTGLQAGVNAYLVKLQREQLLQEVTRLLSMPEQARAQKVS
jgi:two-component system chemotaxis sensor kinase CheA